MKKNIFEVYGLGQLPDPDTPAGAVQLTRKVSIDIKSDLHNGPLLVPGNTGGSAYTAKGLPAMPTDWQKKFYQRVLDKKDSFVSVPPAAGKTSPMMAAWFEQFIAALRGGVNPKSKEFPRIVYIAKTKQLAMEALNQNFQRDSSSGLFNLIAKNLNYFDTTRHLNSDSLLSQNDVNIIYKLVTDLTCILFSGVPRKEILSTEYTLKPIIISTTMGPGSSVDISEVIKTYRDYIHYIVIDEFQQYIPRPGNQLSYGEFTPAIEKDFELVTNIIKTARRPGECGISILTGTVNQETSKKFCQLVDNEYNRKFSGDGLIISYDDRRLDNNGEKNTQFTANRSMVQIVPYEKMKGAKEIEETIVNIVKAQQKNTVMIIFATSRTSQTGIFRMLEKLIGRLPIRNLDDNDVKYFEHFLTKPNQIQDSINRDLKNKLADKKIATTTNTRFGHVNIHDKHVASSITTPKDLTNTMGSNYISPVFDRKLKMGGVETKDVPDVEFLKYFDVDKSEQRFTSDGDAQKYYTEFPDIDNLVYEGIRRGIGVMIGKSDQRHKAIIQKMFRDGKLYIVLATDAVGIGANVTCKHLYITNLEKVDEAGFGPIDSSSLIQLVNRAGRDPGKIPYAFIYTQLKDYDRVKKLFEMDPSLAVEEIPFDQIEKKIKDKRTLLQSVWRSLFT
jgi:hypothetical protein